MMSAPLPGWPRLLDTELAAAYLSMSRDSFERIVAAGAIRPVRPFDDVAPPGGAARKRPTDPRYDLEEIDEYAINLRARRDAASTVADAIVRGETAPREALRALGGSTSPASRRSGVV